MDNKTKAYIGIDIGSNGSAVAIDDFTVAGIRFGQSSQKDIRDFLALYKENYECFAVIEAVHSFPGQGVASMFKFGKNAGFVLGLLVGLEIPFEEKTPMTWMKEFSMKRDKEESQPNYKKRLRQKAQQLFPDQTITLDLADGFLIAEYCRRMRTSVFQGF